MAQLGVAHVGSLNLSGMGVRAECHHVVRGKCRLPRIRETNREESSSGGLSRSIPALLLVPPGDQFGAGVQLCRAHVLRIPFYVLQMKVRATFGFQQDLAAR